MKDLLRLQTKIKAKNVCVHVIPYIHSHNWLFAYISIATITTFLGASLIPEWKLG